MTYRWRSPLLRRLERGVIFSLVLASPVLACGPDFPETYYDMDGRQLLAAPEGFFAVEIERIAHDIVPSQRAIVAPEQNFGAANIEADGADVARALAERGVPLRTAREISASFSESRRQLETAKKENTDWAKLPELAKDLPAGLPAEFAGYFRGAENWARGKITEARTEWSAVLALPAADRRYRSTWAAFMLGRALLAEADASPTPMQARDDAVKNFRRVRVFVNDGLPDPLGLAVASLGWEARVELDRLAYAPAIHLYLEQHAAGDPTALESLRRTAAKLPEIADIELSRLATDVAARRVFTAYLVARGGPSYDGGLESETAEKLAQRWALTLKNAGVRDVPEADRLAWLAYEGGLFVLAKEWAALAPAEGAEAQWIRAKLALRAGDLQAGEKFMRSALAANGLVEPHRARLEAELGRVCLAQDNFSGALEAWLAGGHQEDAAYVAERVMTSKELRTYVDQHVPAPAVTSADTDRSTEFFIRHLLARRLARVGRAEDAVTYFPAQYQQSFATYAAAVRAGFDASHSATERAAAFWRAAKSVEEFGMEFLGTELEPDWGIWGGSFQLDPTAAARLGAPALTGGTFAPTTLETTRLHDQAAPEKRFHYRYRAAELAWWAASLMPNESEETAEILNEAGGWLKARDPEAAKPFYQALVIRCGQTELGREAAARHWFPKTASAADALVPEKSF